MKRFRFLMIRLFLTMGFFILAGTVSAGFDSKDSKKPPGLNEAMPLVSIQPVVRKELFADIQFYRQVIVYLISEVATTKQVLPVILIIRRGEEIKPPRDWVYLSTKNTLVANINNNLRPGLNLFNLTSVGGLPN